MCKTNPTLRDGKMVMLDRNNPSVLSYVRESVAGSPAVVAALNFTAEPQTISLNLKEANISGTSAKTLITNAPSLEKTSSFSNITLPPYASWVASIQ